MLASPGPHVLALFTVRVELMLLVLTALGKQLAEPRWVHLVAASVPGLRARGTSIATYLAPYRAPLVVYDLTAPYRAPFRTLQEALRDGVVRDTRLVLLTNNKLALEAAIGETAALEVQGTATEVDGLVRMLRRRLPAPGARCGARCSRMR